MKSNIIIITGLPGSGKSTLGKALAAKYGFSFLEASDIVKYLYRFESKNESYFEYVNKVIILDGGQRFASRIIKLTNKALMESPGVIICGIRLLNEFRTIKQEYIGAKSIFIKCPTFIRRKRKTLNDPIVSISIDERDEIESKWNVSQFEKLADYVIDCEKDINYLVSLVSMRVMHDD